MKHELHSSGSAAGEPQNQFQMFSPPCSQEGDSDKLGGRTLLLLPVLRAPLLQPTPQWALRGKCCEHLGLCWPCLAPPTHQLGHAALSWSVTASKGSPLVPPFRGKKQDGAGEGSQMCRGGGLPQGSHRFTKQHP